MDTKQRIMFLFIITIIILGFSCDEALPPYENPANVFEAKISGIYHISPFENVVKVFITLSNKYDETFEGES